MKVSIISNRHKDNNNILLDKTVSIFKNAGFDVQDALGTGGDKLYSDTDAVITIGGDGTFINSASRAIEFGVPIVGINAGTTGFLADVAPRDIEKLCADLQNNNYYIEERSILKACITRESKKNLKYYAVNEVVVSRGQLSKLIQFGLKIDGELVYQSYGDGLIIAAPTGSTAYSFSAGGPVLDVRASGAVITPLCHHSLNTRPIVIDSSRVIALTVDKAEDDAHLFIDNTVTEIFTPKDILEITIPDKKLKYIRLKGTDFFNTLKKKLTGVY